MARRSSARHLEVEVKVQPARLGRLKRGCGLAALAPRRHAHGSGDGGRDGCLGGCVRGCGGGCLRGCGGGGCGRPAKESAHEARAHAEDARVHRARLGEPARTGRQQRLRAQCLGRRLLQEARHGPRRASRAALAVRLAKDKDAVAAALLQRGGLAEAAQVTARKAVGQRRRVEVDDHVARGEDQLALCPGVAEVEREQHVEHHGGEGGGRGQRERREELALGHVARQAAALAPGMQQQHPPAREEGRRAVRERFGVRGGGHLGRLLAQERHESDERAATGADAPAWRVAVHAEGDRLRVQALRNAQERR